MMIFYLSFVFLASCWVAGLAHLRAARCGNLSGSLVLEREAAKFRSKKIQRARGDNLDSFIQSHKIEISVFVERSPLMRLTYTKLLAMFNSCARVLYFNNNEKNISG